MVTPSPMVTKRVCYNSYIHTYFFTSELYSLPTLQALLYYSRLKLLTPVQQNLPLTQKTSTSPTRNVVQGAFGFRHCCL